MRMAAEGRILEVEMKRSVLVLALAASVLALIAAPAIADPGSTNPNVQYRTLQASHGNTYTGADRAQVSEERCDRCPSRVDAPRRTLRAPMSPRAGPRPLGGPPPANPQARC